MIDGPLGKTPALSKEHPMQEHTPHTLPSSSPARISRAHRAPRTVHSIRQVGLCAVRGYPRRGWMLCAPRRACLIVAALALLATALSARQARADASCVNVSGALQV